MAHRSTSTERLLVRIERDRFQPLLYQIATAGLSDDDIAYPVRGILRRQRNATFRMGTVVGADLAAGSVTLSDGAVTPFDSLVIAVGAVSHSFGVDGVDDHALAMKSVGDAEAIRDHVLKNFEAVAVDPAAVDDGTMNVVIVGGGPTGVELAGGVAELFAKVLHRDLPTVDLRRARVIVVEAADRLLSTFTPASSDRARRTLGHLGVEVILGCGVARVAADGAELTDGTWLPANTVIWAAGVRAHPVAAALGVPLTSRGRIDVAAALSVVGHEHVFAIGDVAGDLPQVAQPAIQGGVHVAASIGRRLRGEETDDFAYRDKGSMATIGRNDAVTELPGDGILGVRRFDGFVGWLAWLGLHLVELVGMRNRLRVLVSWAWNYVTYDRGARLLAADDQHPTVTPGVRPQR